MKNQWNKIASNWLGAGVGAVGVYFAAKKYGNVSNKWALVALGVVGAVAGAYVQSKIKGGAPTKDSITVTKK